MKKQKLLLIVGCGRSGTSYICELLQKSGIHIKHEEEGIDGIVSWPMTTGDSSIPPLGPTFEDYEFKNIFHQIRNPTKTIASSLTISESSWQYIKKYIPIKDDDSKLVMAAKYWYYWNLLAEKIANFRYRIEDIDNALPIIINKIGKGKFDHNNINNTSKKINTRKHDEIMLNNIKAEDSDLFNNIINLARKYGYPEEELI